MNYKKLLLGTGIVVIVIGAWAIYYFGLYTYLIRTEVMEPLPAPADESESMEVLGLGSFVGIDFIHKGSGTAKLVQMGDAYLLRLEDFSVTSGPDLYVYLAKGNVPTNDPASLGDYLDLGLLKGTSGNQNYEIPVDPAGYTTVVIWCKRFGVLFSYALLQ